MIYLASPYTDPDLAVMEQRYRWAMECTVALLKRKLWVYSPIVHCHELARVYDLPRDYDFWREYNTHMVKLCHKLMVLTIPGWMESKGIKGELECARAHNKPCVGVSLHGGDLVYEIL